jgi:hypothetical protein
MQAAKDLLFLLNTVNEALSLQLYTCYALIYLSKGILPHEADGSSIS